MEERVLISPGVLTRERDLSALPQAIADISTAFVGPTEKGPAFVPVTLTKPSQYTTMFGGSAKGTYYMAPAVKGFLAYPKVATIIRILGLDGYKVQTPILLNVLGQTSAVLAPAKALGAGESLQVSLNGDGGRVSAFVLTLSSSAASASYSCSLDPDSDIYVTKVFGTDPLGPAPLYVYSHFDSHNDSLATTATVSMTSSVDCLNFNSMSYDAPVTPWIVSQNVGGNRYQLFKLEAISDGTNANREIKVAIANVRPASEIPGSDYGTFTVTVRGFNDTDRRPQIYETFTNLTLDPESPRYLPRAIGDRSITIDEEDRMTYNGQYANQSAFIRVVMTTGSLPMDVVPYGFEAYKMPLASTAAAWVPTMSMKTNQLLGSDVSLKVYYGVDFVNSQSVQYCAPLPGTPLTGANVPFYLDTYEPFSASVVADRKFIMGLQGGFDGFNPATPRNVGADITADNMCGYDLSGTTTAGTTAYQQAIDLFANPDEFDIAELYTPGVLYSLHPHVVNYCIDATEDRQDFFYVFDSVGQDATVDDAEQSVDDLDTSYAATYYPWVSIVDPDTGKAMWVPPSVLIAGTYALNDTVGAEWFAPAGLTRGGLGGALQARYRLNKTDRDELYERRVNPIATFSGQPVVWGQRTLQLKASALDRINVRRLMNKVKKYIASVSRFIVFEQNTPATRQRFTSIVNPYLEAIQQRQGLYAFRVRMDDSLNTPDIIDRNMLVGQILLQPVKSAEFIIIDFTLLPTGATFDD